MNIPDALGANFESAYAAVTQQGSDTLRPTLPSRAALLAETARLATAYAVMEEMDLKPVVSFAQQTSTQLGESHNAYFVGAGNVRFEHSHENGMPIVINTADRVYLKDPLVDDKASKAWYPTLTGKDLPASDFADTVNTMLRTVQDRSPEGIATHPPRNLTACTGELAMREVFEIGRLPSGGGIWQGRDDIGVHHLWRDYYYPLRPATLTVEPYRPATSQPLGHNRGYGNDDYSFTTAHSSINMPAFPKSVILGRGDQGQPPSHMLVAPSFSTLHLPTTSI